MPTSYDEEERIYHKGFREGYAAALEQSERFGTARVRKEGALSRPSPKPKRKASAYNKRYAREYRRLKKKHPRTSFAALAKKAHKAARRK